MGRLRGLGRGRPALSWEKKTVEGLRSNGRVGDCTEVRFELFMGESREGEVMQWSFHDYPLEGGIWLTCIRSPTGDWDDWIYCEKGLWLKKSLCYHTLWGTKTIDLLR